MSQGPIVERLLYAARQSYTVMNSGPVSDDARFAPIGWRNVPTGVAVGEDRVDAALIGQTASEVIVAFRGTLPPFSDSPDKKQVLLDWLGDFDALLVAGTHLPGLVHRGFLEALDALWPAVTAAIPPDKPIYFVGHSKGGSLANLAAARWAKEHPGLPPAVVTFAASKPGDAAFQTEYDKIVPHSIRYEFQDDVVPHVPPGVSFHDLMSTIPFLGGALATLESAKMTGTAGFVSVGELLFINWDSPNAIVRDSPILRLQRYQHIAELIIELNFAKIVAAHDIGDHSGYARALLPQT